MKQVRQAIMDDNLLEFREHFVENMAITNLDVISKFNLMSAKNLSFILGFFCFF